MTDFSIFFLLTENGFDKLFVGFRYALLVAFDDLALETAILKRQESVRTIFSSMSPLTYVNQQMEDFQIQMIWPQQQGPVC